MKPPYAEMVAQKLIEQLEQGTAPLVKPWRAGERFMPYNPISGRTYRGINALRLLMAGSHYTDARWLTSRQARLLGGQVRRGEKGAVIQYWKFREQHTLLDESGTPVRDAQGEPVKLTTELERPQVFSAVVFNAEQVNGLPEAPLRLTPPEWERHALAEHILAGLGVVIRHISGDRAYYSPRTDTITLPERGQFGSADAFYAVALHEAARAAGHSGRLGRDLTHPRGSPGSAREELRVAIAGLILCEQLGIGYDPGQHAAYARHWITILSDTPLEIFRAASDAERIVRYLRQRVPQLSEEVGQEAVITVTAAGEGDHRPGPQARASERVYLSVPYAERQQVKHLGARWDKNARSWYIPGDTPLAPFERWRRTNDRDPLRLGEDPRQEFGEALRRAGLLIEGPPEMDGKLRRVRVEGDRRGAKSGAYAGFLDGHPAGYIENFKAGLKENWKASAAGVQLTAHDRERLFREAAERRAIREDRAKAIHNETIGLLIPYLDKLAPATADHPYLRSKAVGRHGVGIGVSCGPLNILAGEDKPQLWGGAGDLIIPLHTFDGQLVGTQSIGPDGRKSFPRGCRWGGGMYLMTGRIPTRGTLDTIVIAEGYATAATIHELTGLPVAAALTAGNLEAVARGCRERHPGADIYIAGDNDHQKERETGPDGRPKKNVGREAATKAAQAAGAMTVLPPFAEHEHGSDWNDLAKLKGPQEWQRLWRAGVEAAKLEIETGRGWLVRPDAAEAAQPRSLLEKVMRAVKR
jgi:putative DNA primase/helicase